MENINKQRRTFILIIFRSLNMVPWNSALGGTERTQIDFLSDVLAPVAPLDLKVLNNNSGSIDDLSLAWPPEATDTRFFETKFINNEHLILHINWWFLRTPIALPNSQRFTVFVKFLYFTEFSKSLFTNQGCSLFTFARCPSFHCFLWYLMRLLLKWKVSFNSFLHVLILKDRGWERNHKPWINQNMSTESC